MTDIFATLKTVLQTTGVPVYYERLPVNESPGSQWIRFQMISESEFSNHSGSGNLMKSRFQVTCVGRTHADLIALVALMKAALSYNVIDFQVAFPLEGFYIPDGAETFHKDYYIFYTP
jgi:hypothetical protein